MCSQAKGIFEEIVSKNEVRTRLLEPRLEIGMQERSVR